MVDEKQPNMKLEVTDVGAETESGNLAETSKQPNNEQELTKEFQEFVDKFVKLHRALNTKIIDFENQYRELSLQQKTSELNLLRIRNGELDNLVVKQDTKILGKSEEKLIKKMKKRIKRLAKKINKLEDKMISVNDEEEKKQKPKKNKQLPKSSVTKDSDVDTKAVVDEFVEKTKKIYKLIKLILLDNFNVTSKLELNKIKQELTEEFQKLNSKNLTRVENEDNSEVKKIKQELFGYHYDKGSYNEALDKLENMSEVLQNRWENFERLIGQIESNYIAKINSVSETSISPTVKEVREIVKAQPDNFKEALEFFFKCWDGITEFPINTFNSLMYPDSMPESRKKIKSFINMVHLRFFARMDEISFVDNDEVKHTISPREVIKKMDSYFKEPWMKRVVNGDSYEIVPVENRNGSFVRNGEPIPGEKDLQNSSYVIEAYINLQPGANSINKTLIKSASVKAWKELIEQNEEQATISLNDAVGNTIEIQLTKQKLLDLISEDAERDSNNTILSFRDRLFEDFPELKSMPSLIVDSFVMFAIFSEMRFNAAIPYYAKYKLSPIPNLIDLEDMKTVSPIARALYQAQSATSFDAIGIPPIWEFPEERSGDFFTKGKVIDMPNVTGSEISLPKAINAFLPSKTRKPQNVIDLAQLLMYINRNFDPIDLITLKPNPSLKILPTMHDFVMGSFNGRPLKSDLEKETVEQYNEYLENVKSFEKMVTDGYVKLKRASELPAKIGELINVIKVFKNLFLVIPEVTDDTFTPYVQRLILVYLKKIYRDYEKLAKNNTKEMNPEEKMKPLFVEFAETVISKFSDAGTMPAQLITDPGSNNSSITNRLYVVDILKKAIEPYNQANLVRRFASPGKLLDNKWAVFFTNELETTSFEMKFKRFRYSEFFKMLERYTAKVSKEKE